MEKKGKALDNSRHFSGHNQGSFPRSSTVSGRFPPLHREPINKISDPKSKKALPMRRPKTHPELLDRGKPALEPTPWLNLDTPPVLSKKLPPVESTNNKSVAKLLVKVTVAQSIGALRVLVPRNATVVDVIKATLTLYAKEGRRPILSSDPLSFGLHYSQFTIDCLNPNDKMEELGCRNFFLCRKKESIEKHVGCGREMDKISGMREPWNKLLNYFLALP